MTTTHIKYRRWRGLRDRVFESNQHKDGAAAELARREPITERDPVRWMREMMRGDAFGAISPWVLRVFGRREWVPTFEVRENGSSLHILADIPGIPRDDLELQLTGNRLVISGKRADVPTSDEYVHTSERSFGQFTRAFMLPDYVDIDRVSCDLRDGVLTIVVPKKAGEAPRKLAIGAPATKA